MQLFFTFAKSEPTNFSYLLSVTQKRREKMNLVAYYPWAHNERHFLIYLLIWNRQREMNFLHIFFLYRSSFLKTYTFPRNCCQKILTFVSILPTKKIGWVLEEIKRDFIKMKWRPWKTNQKSLFSICFTLFFFRKC